MQPDTLDAALAAELALVIHGEVAPILADLKALHAQVAGWEARWQDHGAVRERLAVLEAKQAAQPVVVDMEPDGALVDLRARLASVEDVQRKDAARIEGYTAFLQRDLAAVSERTAVLETRAPVAGPPGADGLNGKDGVDGLGFDDLDFVIDDERKGCFLRFARGEQVKEFRLPLPFHVGPYRPGEHYEKANIANWASAWWLAKGATSDKPGDTSTMWKLVMKPPRDGKDGRDGVQGPQGKAGKNWNEK